MTRRRPCYEQLLPYGTVGIGMLAKVITQPTVLEAGSPHLWLLVPVLVILAVRQVVVVADHTLLARSLADAVELRTAELRGREQWWRDLVQNLSDVVVVVDTDLRVRYLQPARPTTCSGRLAEEIRDAGDDDRPRAPRRRRGRGRGGVPDPHRPPAAWLRGEPGAAGRRLVGLVRGHGAGTLAERELRRMVTLHHIERRQRTSYELAGTYDALRPAQPGDADEGVEQALEAPTHQRSALLLVDLDDFKVIDDRHGHASGDLVLEVIGRRLRKRSVPVTPSPGSAATSSPC